MDDGRPARATTGRKRDLERDSGARGRRPAAARSERPRFVVQEHHASNLHWDLRLERDGALASWALPKGVPRHPQEDRLAVRTEDHPLEYLDLRRRDPEGELRRRDDAVWDRGTYELREVSATTR